jgi:hypothetical protein
MQREPVPQVFTIRPGNSNSSGYENTPRMLRPHEGANPRLIPSPPESPTFESNYYPRLLSLHPVPEIMEESISDEIKIIDLPPDHEIESYQGNSNRGHDVVDASSLMNEWSTITRRRDEILVLRSRIHEMRGLLRSKQNMKSSAEDKLIQQVRKQELGLIPSQNIPTDQKPLLALIEDCQDARDNYGPIEYECNNLEDQLYQDEFALDKIERRFFSRWSEISGIQRAESDVVPTRQEISPGPVKTIQIHDTDDEEFSYHPLVETYLSRKGDLDILREQFVDFEERLYFIEEEQKSRGQYNISLSSEDQEFLQSSYSARERLLADIRRTERDVEELHKECLLMKLVDSSGEPTNLNGEHWQESDEWKRLEADEDIDSSAEVSEYSKYSILLSKNESRPGSAGTIETSRENEAKADEELEKSLLWRVNSWMLENLQCSALDVNYLARESRWMSITIGDPWQIEVLRTWFKDNFPILIPSIRTYASSMTTQAPYQSKALESTLTPSSHTRRSYITKSKPLHRFHDFDSAKSDVTEIQNAVGIGS